MTITQVAATYRARIADRGATTVAGNVALTLNLADLAAMPAIRGPSVDFLRGRTTSQPFDLECLEDGVLFTDSGRMAAIGRLVEIARSTDGGSSWSPLATGRVKGTYENRAKGKPVVRVTDERWTERETQIFQTTDTVQLHPPGLAAAWMNEPAAGEGTYLVLDTDGSAVKLAAEGIGGQSLGGVVPAGLRQALADDLVAPEDRDNSVSNSAGNFDELRFRWTETNGSPITASDNNVIGFITPGTGTLSSTGTGGLLGQLSPSENATGGLNSAWVYLGSHGLSAGEEIGGRFYFPGGVRVNETVPLHIGGVSGVHPMTLLRDILDGDYGGDAVLYDSDALDDLEDLSMSRVWVRATQPEDRGAWLEANLYPVYNVCPLVGLDLAPRPTALRLGQGIVPGNLLTVSANEASETDWDHTSNDLVNVIQFESRAVRRISDLTDRGDDWPADRYDSIRQSYDEIEHDNTGTLGRFVRKIETDLIISRSSAGFRTADNTVRTLAQEIFDVFGDGPQSGYVTIDDDQGADVGDLVVLDQDTLQGFNPEDDARTGDRIVRLVTFTERTPAAVRFEYLDLGPSSTALSAPTVSIAQDGTDPDLANVTISGLGAGESAVVECTTADTTPAEYDYRRSGVDNETISFRFEPPADNAYARAYAFAPNRIRSPWAEDDVAMSSALPALEGASINRALTTATVAWDAGTAGGVRTTYHIHNRGSEPNLTLNQQDYDVADGEFEISGVIGTHQMVTVQLVPYAGFSGGSVTGASGRALILEGILQKIDGGVFLRRAPLTGINWERDQNGEAVVTVFGDEEAADVYVTVGDGTTPADPTAGANDGSVSGRVGTIETGVAITTGNAAIIKAVSADAAGNLGPVTTSRFSARLGPFHKDTSTRSTSGTGEDTLETITVPANTLGANGVLKLILTFEFNGSANTKRVRLSFGGSVYLVRLAGAGDLRIESEVMNDESVSSQIVTGLSVDSPAANVGVHDGITSVDTTQDQDIVITGECDDAGDSIDLNVSVAFLWGTN